MTMPNGEQSQLPVGDYPAAPEPRRQGCLMVLAKTAAVGIVAGGTIVNVANAWTDGYLRGDTYIADHTTTVKPDELSVVSLDAFTDTPVAMAGVLVSLTINDSTTTREAKIPTPLGEVTVPEVEVAGMTMAYNPLITNKATGKKLPRTLANMLLMYGDERLKAVNFNQSAYDRNTAKLAAGADPSELEPVLTVALDAGNFKSVVIAGNAEDNKNLFVVKRRSLTTNARAAVDLLLSSGVIPPVVHDEITGGQATATEQQEQALHDVAKNAENEYATGVCAPALMKAAQEASQETNQTPQANKAGSKLGKIMKQKFASLINMGKQVWSRSGESTRSVVPEEVGLKITGNFATTAIQKSPAPSPSDQSTGIFGTLGNVFVKKDPVVSLGQTECKIDIPDKPITDTVEAIQAQLDKVAKEVVA